MLPFTTKICGITEPHHALDAMDAGAEAIGLNFYSRSKRSVSEAAAKQIIEALASNAKVENLSKPAVVGVFVNHSPGEILALANALSLDGIQLHGDETSSFFVNLKKSFAEPPAAPTQKLPFFVRAIRTQPAAGNNDDTSQESDRVRSELVVWSEAGIDLLLLDAAATGEFGGTGKTIDWSLVPDFQSLVPQPIVLAGGLKANNVAQAIAISKVVMVDVASGVESDPGKKDPQLVRQFVANARLAFGPK